MKILAISAFHPPDHSGGFELRVKEILDGLAQRGHMVRLLTNLPEKTGFREDPQNQYPVMRRLHNRFNARHFPQELLFDLEDTRLLNQQLRFFQPDVIYLGHIYILSKGLLPSLARQSLPIYYDEGGSGLIDAWQDHGRWFRFCGGWRSGYATLNWLKPLAVRLVCALSAGRIGTDWEWPKTMHIVFNSHLNQENAAAAGVPIENSMVLHSGVNTNLFSFQPREGFHKPLHIIVPGRLERRKGQSDAIELLKCLLDAGMDTRLLLAGARWSDGYAAEVAACIRQYGLQEKVEIKPMLTPDDLVDEYHRADICFFPSYFHTGFSRTPLEAMSCGCVVISYGNEGSDEIIQDGENGFTLKAGDIANCAELIQQIITSKSRIKKILATALQLVKTEHALPVYQDRIETLLKNLSKDGVSKCPLH